MSTNPFVCQPNLQKIGGFLPFVRALCRIDRDSSFTPTVRSRLKRAPPPYKTKVQHPESADVSDQFV